MGKSDRITERQLRVLAFLSLLSPMIRVLPAAAVMFGGRPVWLSPIPAYIAGLIYVGLLRGLAGKAPEGQGLADLALSGLGGAAGRAFCVLCAAWLTFYTGFLTRSAAERLLATVYPNGNTTIFIVVLLLASAFTASGMTKTLSRTAEVLMPIIVAVAALVILSAVSAVSPEALLPVTYRDSARILYGAIPIFNVIAAFSYFLFLRGFAVRSKGVRPNHFPWLGGLILMAFSVTLVSLGTLGDKLSISMDNAFFMVIRNIRVFGLIERVEAVVVAIWVVTDFIFLSALLMIVGEIWRTVTGAGRHAVFVIPTAILSGAAAFLICDNAFELQKWSDYLIPLINLIFSLVLIPSALAVGKIRKKF